MTLRGMTMMMGLARGVGIVLIATIGLDAPLAHADAPSTTTYPFTLVRFPALTSFPTFVVDAATGGQAITLAKVGGGSAPPATPPLVITGVDAGAFTWAAAQVKSGAAMAIDVAWGTVTPTSATLTSGTRFTGKLTELDVVGDKITLAANISASSAETPIRPDGCASTQATQWALRLPGYPNASLSAKGGYDGRIQKMTLTAGAQAVTMTFVPPNVTALGSSVPSFITWATANKVVTATVIPYLDPAAVPPPTNVCHTVAPPSTTIQLPGASLTAGNGNPQLAATSFTIGN